MTATMDGRKIGYLHYRRMIENGNTVIESTLSVRFARTTKPLQILNTVREVESPRGDPLAFSSSTDMSAVRSSTSGRRVAPGKFRIRVRVDNRLREYMLTWPQHALLDNGMRKAFLAHGFRPGTRYVLHHFDVSSLSASTLHFEVLGKEDVELPGGMYRLTHLRQTRQSLRTKQVTDLWVNSDGDVLKSSTPLYGFKLEMLACDKACANRPDQGVDVLKNAMVDVPRPLPMSLRNLPLRFVFRSTDIDSAPFINTDMQIVSRFGQNIWIVNTTAVRHNSERPPQPSDLAPNDWLQSDSPKIHALALKATHNAHNSRQRMQRLTDFVRHYIHREGPSVGYASALETLRTRQGDCTEFAVLLAAMARSLGIPARVVTGLTYSDHYAGEQQVMVPHTWVQAWVHGAWRGYDAALPGFDHAHIAMAVGDGDPWTYFNGISSLGNLQLLSVMPSSQLGQDQFDIPNTPFPPLPRGSGGGSGR